jgi:hypothetical protein
MPEPIIITLGQEGSSTELLEQLISEWDIQLVLDIRARPGRKTLGKWEKRHLRRVLNAKGLSYHWMGQDLGQIPEWQHLVDKRGLVLPVNLVPREVWKHLSKLRKLLERQRILILGTVADAYQCPRFYRLSPIFQLWACKVLHFHAEGMRENWQLELDLAAEYLPMRAERGFPLGLIFAYQAHRQKLEARVEEDPPDEASTGLVIFRDWKWSLQDFFWSLGG